MAYIVERTYKNGDTRYQVKWRTGGARGGKGQSEQFDTPEAATAFKTAVDDAGQQWPIGWVKGVGYVVPGRVPHRFREFALRVVEERTGIEERTREDYIHLLERWVFPTFGECDVRSAEHFSKSTISRWLNWIKTQPVRGGGTTSPKTIQNVHSLLSLILGEAVDHEPPLRARNPCRGVTLPRADDEVDDDKTFLTPQEFDLLLSKIRRREDQILALVAYGTGLRYGEVTALQPRDLALEEAGYRLRVQRTWKKLQRGQGAYLGVPKSRRSRRTIGVSTTVVEALDELGERRLDALYFTGPGGGQLLHGTYRRRWAIAVRDAQKEGLRKSPTPHDLRHSHAAALLAAGIPLIAVSRRLGHESIKTTSDIYGHVLPELEADGLVAIEQALAGSRPTLRRIV